MEVLLRPQPDQPGMALGSAAGLEDLSEPYQAEVPLVLKASATDCDETRSLQQVDARMVAIMLQALRA